jgi:hypothetical protein
VLDSGFVLPAHYSPLPWSTDPGLTDILTAQYNATAAKWWVLAFNKGY